MKIQKKNANRKPVKKKTTPKPVITPEPTPKPVERVSMEVAHFPFDYYKSIVRNKIMENYSVPSVLLGKDLKCLMKLVLDKSGKVVELWNDKKFRRYFARPGSCPGAIMNSSFPPLPVGYNDKTVTFTLTFLPEES